MLVVDAAPAWRRGGNTRHTRNCRIAHDRVVGPLTGPYPAGEFMEDLLRVNGGETDDALAALVIERSQDLLDWLERRGVRFQPALRGTLTLDRTNAFFLGGGRTLLNALYRAAAALGVAVRYETEVLEVERDPDGAVCGVRARTPEGDLAIRCRALVVAAGGFEANLDWLAEVWGEGARKFHVRGTPHNRGLLLRHLLETGAGAVGDPTQCHAVAVDARGPVFDGGIVTRLDCIPFAIVVDATGRRFHDEGEDIWPKRYAIWGRLVAQRRGQRAWAILDERALGLFLPPLFPPLEAAGWDELAAITGAPPAVLRGTVESYNDSVREGAFDPQRPDSCHTEGLDPPKSHWARRIEGPPFFVFPLAPGITFTYLALRVDGAMRVLDPSGTPLPGLFAAGEAMAGNVLRRGYLAGIGMTIGSVSGRIAGTEAARHVR
ncbi:Fumarate reductase flavoprotein subunit [bacterium HR39]|nr:Fumarate reductase flavoprotein subunit [bacterium HR39]